MKRFKNKWLLIFALTVIVTVIAGTALVMGDSNSAYTVVATNDLGMHCTCPTYANWLLLPPFNTIRVQVIKKGSSTASAVSSGITVSYSMVEENDAKLIADPYYQLWITYAPKMFPGYVPVKNNKVIGIASTGITGTAVYDSQSKSWIAKGIPVFPVTTGTTTLDIMTDSFGGANRDPYLTAKIVVSNSTGSVLGQTTTVVPVAFGGCCTCHLKLAAANGYPSTSAGSFQYMAKLHGQNASKVDISYLDPDGDGVGGPIRCSWCHWDPAMGESAAPGIKAIWPNFKIISGATFTAGQVKVSQYSFSQALHMFHTQDALVKSSTYDPNIATNCYDCHPGTGNNVNCYRGVHKSTSTLWCVDCHGNLNQRVSGGQLTHPWQEASLPTCFKAATGAVPSAACHSSSSVPQTTWTSAFGGYFINARGGMGNLLLCESCHGSVHAENPSTMALDNVQNAKIHTSLATTFTGTYNKNFALGSCRICHTNQSNVWTPNIMRQGD
jgi:hypothetical protein